jgi:hypothetical protein
MAQPQEPVTEHTAAWLSGGRVEATVPKRFRDNLQLTGGQSVAFIPTLDDLTFRFLVVPTATDERANVRTLKANAQSAKLDLRFPTVLGAATGLRAHVRDRSDTRLNFRQPASDRDRDPLLVWPTTPLRPTIAPDAGQDLDLAPLSKRLHDQGSEYAADLPNRFATAFGLAAQDSVAWRISVRDARLALVADFDTQRIPDDSPTTRTVQVHESGVADALSDQYRVHPPKGLVEALYCEDVKLEFRAERQRLALQPALDLDPRTNV